MISGELLFEIQQEVTPFSISTGLGTDPAVLAVAAEVQDTTERQQLVEALGQAKARQESLSAQLQAQRETLETTLRKAESRVQTSAEAGAAERAQLETSLREADARYRQASEQRVAEREALQATRREAETRQQALAAEHAAERQQLVEALGQAKARQESLSAQLLAQRETLETTLREAESRVQTSAEAGIAERAQLETSLRETEARSREASEQQVADREALQAALRDAETREQALAAEHATERQQLVEALGQTKACQELLSAQLLAQRETLEEALREAESRYRLLSEQSTTQQAALQKTLGEVEMRCHVLSDERDRMRKALAESEHGSRSWAKAAPYGVIHCDAEGQFVDLNPNLVALLGYSSAQDLIGPDRGIDLCVDPVAWRRLVEQCRQAEHFEEAEVQWKDKHGHALTLTLSGQARRNVGGNIEGYEMIAQDVTRLRVLEAQLRQAWTKEAVAYLSEAVATELDRLVPAFTRAGDLLGAGFDPEGGRPSGDELKTAANRVSALARQLLVLSKRQAYAPQSLDLNDVVTHMQQVLAQLVGRDIELRIALASHLGQVLAHLDQVEQILMTLTLNARTAMPLGGTLTVRTVNVDLDQTLTSRPDCVEPGRYVLLAVDASGCGIKLPFPTAPSEPFAVTPEATAGTSRPDTAIERMVSLCGGHLTTQLDNGLETCVTVYFPRHDE